MGDVVKLTKKALGGIIGLSTDAASSVGGELLGSMVDTPKMPSAPPPPPAAPAPTATAAPPERADAQEEADEEERRRPRRRAGRAQNILTGAGGLGTPSPGSLTRKTLGGG